MIELPPLKKYAYRRDAYGRPSIIDAYEAASVEARERILLNRIAELEADRDSWKEQAEARVEDWAKEYERAKQLEADAERYRWLRDEAQYADNGLPYVIAWKRGRSVGEQEILAEEELDAAIDAARKGE